jgi:hypothetical protein
MSKGCSDRNDRARPRPSPTASRCRHASITGPAGPARTLGLRYLGRLARDLSLQMARPPPRAARGSELVIAVSLDP